MCSILNFLFSPPCPQGTDQVTRQHNRSMSRRRFYHLYRVSSQFSAFSSIFFQLHVACSANFKFLSAQLVNVREAVWSSVSWCPIATYSCLPIHFLLLPQLLTSPTLVYEYKYTFTFQFTFYFYHNNLPGHLSSTNTNTNIQLPSSYFLPQLLSSTSLVRKYKNTFTF